MNVKLQQGTPKRTARTKAVNVGMGFTHLPPTNQQSSPSFGGLFSESMRVLNGVEEDIPVASE